MGSVCKHLVRYRLLLSNYQRVTHTMSIYDESTHHESRDKAAAAAAAVSAMIRKRGGERKKNPSRPPPTDRRRLGAVKKRRGMREREAGNRLASRPPRRLAHPNYWAPANCPTPGPVVPVYNAYALHV